MLLLRFHALIAVLLLLVTSCTSPRFRDDWSTALATDRDSLTDSIEGPWSGTWRSNQVRHAGKLRCLISPTETQGTYRFSYAGTFAKIIPFRYTVEHEVERVRKGHAFKGQQDLGVFGSFTHEGWASGNRLDSAYKSEKDHGVFELRRPWAE